jgi:hypothetical protein
MGVAVVTFLVREGPTRRPLGAASDELGAITRVTPSEIETRLVAAEATA